MTIRLFSTLEPKPQRRRHRLLPPSLLPLLVGLALLQLHYEWQGKKHSLKSYHRRFLEEPFSSHRVSSKTMHLQAQNKIDCKVARGNSGRWVQDWQMAEQTHYKVSNMYTDWPLAEQQFVPTEDEPFRWSTTWRWKDDHCPVEVLTSKDEFCDLLWDLDIRRCLMVGDSLTMEFGVALLSLLGHPPNRPTFNSMFRPYFMTCPKKRQPTNTTSAANFVRPAFDITLWIVRRSPIKDLHAMCYTAKANTTSKKHWDYDYRKAMLSDDHKTAIIFNTGVWLQEGLEEFKGGFHCMVDWVDSLNQHRRGGVNSSNILAFYRPANRPNFDCVPQENGNTNGTQQPVRQSPHTSLDEYYQVAKVATKNESIVLVGDTTYKYKTADGVIFSTNWEYAEDYNDYARRYLENRTMHQLESPFHSNTSTVPIYWLNTYHSTALRRDGHIGYGDCLHYSLPGPPDWWVHFFYTFLLDLQQDQHASMKTTSSMTE